MKTGPAAKKRKIISLDSSDESDSVEETQPAPATTSRKIELTPPPIVEEDTVRQAIAMISKRPQTTTRTGHTRRRTNSSLGESDHPTTDEDEDEDDFDIEQYQASMTRTTLSSIVDNGVDHGPPILIFLQGHNEANERLPETWEKPLALKVMPRKQFKAMREEFAKNKGYDKEVVFVRRGVKVMYGSPGLIHMQDQEWLGMTIVDIC